jgi:hypothetical protein
LVRMTDVLMVVLLIAFALVPAAFAAACRRM